MLKCFSHLYGKPTPARWAGAGPVADYPARACFRSAGLATYWIERCADSRSSIASLRPLRGPIGATRAFARVGLGFERISLRGRLIMEMRPRT